MQPWTYIVIFSLTFFVSHSYSQADQECQSLFNQQKYESAFLSCKSCYEIDTTKVDCLQSLAYAAIQIGDQASAKKYLITLTKKDSLNANIYAQLALIYEQQQQLPKAIKYYSIVNKMLPNSSIYFRKNAALYKAYGELKDAFRLYSKAYELNPRDLISIKGIAELMLHNDQDEDASKLINQGLNIDSLNVGLGYLKAKSKYKQKQYDSVTYILKRLSYQVDLNSYYNKLLGYAYLQIDSTELAIQKLGLALIEDEDSEQLHYYMATAFEKLGNIEGALHHFEKAVENGISKDIDIYHRNVARIAKDQNDLRKAIDHYKDAYKYGKDPVLLYHLAVTADTYYKDKSIAINYYKKYLNSKNTLPAYASYAQKRMHYLKEVRHQKGNTKL